ncbi:MULTISPECIES: hypothetical protein [Citrobacter]|uniref:hypothetical protein n=1 Tax=Citrobacter TaxID=544 RepID=UPI001656FC35|nr:MULTISPECIES: hypothetical protein [Citrobacter]
MIANSLRQQLSADWGISHKQTAGGIIGKPIPGRVATGGGEIVGYQRIADKKSGFPAVFAKQSDADITATIHVYPPSWRRGAEIAFHPGLSLKRVSGDRSRRKEK